MSEQDPFGTEDTPMGEVSDASDFEVWESLEGLKEMISEVMSERPRTSFVGDEFYCVGFQLLTEEDGLVSSIGYDYEGEFVELVEEDDEAYVILRDVNCHILPSGEGYTHQSRELFWRDTLFIAHHTVMRVPISKFSYFAMSVNSKFEIEAEHAHYSSPADIIAKAPPQDPPIH